MQNNPETLEIYNETKWQIPDLPFLAIKNRILGKSFNLSFSILEPKNSTKINRKQRKQNYTPNTLSFKYSESSGEIIFTPEIIDAENYDFLEENIGQTLDNKMLYLFIHSTLHLKDLDHGPKMEKLEEKYFKIYRS